LSDGITEDLITGLARIPWLFVIARNSSFVYKNRSVDIRQVSRELGVRYILKGSVRRAAEHLRVTAQLIDVASGRHLWAERYDALYQNVFELQDEITDRVVANTVPELTLAEIERARHKRPSNLDAWDYYLRALPAMRQSTRDANQEAIGLLMRANELDPRFATAYARLSVCYGTAAYYGWEGSAADSIGRAFEFARKAAAIDPQNAFAHDALASAQLFSGDLDGAVSAATRALQLDPSLSAAYGTLINALAFLGRSDEAIAFFEKADRASPRDPERSGRLMGLVSALFVEGRYEEVVDAARQHILLKPAWYGGHLLLAATLGLLGRKAEAEAAGKQLLALIPRFRLAGVVRRPMFRNAEVIQRIIEGLRQAGIPE
jgi:TolB-like protein/Flp pilus assembly protein TadD